MQQSQLSQHGLCNAPNRKLPVVLPYLPSFGKAYGITQHGRIDDMSREHRCSTSRMVQIILQLLESSGHENLIHASQPSTYRMSQMYLSFIFPCLKAVYFPTKGGNTTLHANRVYKAWVFGRCFSSFSVLLVWSSSLVKRTEIFK